MTHIKNPSYDLYACLERRILLLDGGFGTMVQGYGLDEEAYRGERFRDCKRQLKGTQRPARADPSPGRCIP